MKYPIEKYNIVVHQHPEYAGIEIIAWSTYAGKAVYGKCLGGVLLYSFFAFSASANLLV